MKDQRECGGCYQPVRECECETQDERVDRQIDDGWDRIWDERWREHKREHSGAPLLGALVFFFASLLTSPAFAASPLCVDAVDMEYGNTSTPRPKLALDVCESVRKLALAYGVRDSLAVAVYKAGSLSILISESHLSHFVVGIFNILFSHLRGHDCIRRN